MIKVFVLYMCPISLQSNQKCFITQEINRVSIPFGIHDYTKSKHIVLKIVKLVLNICDPFLPAWMWFLVALTEPDSCKLSESGFAE